VSAITGTFGITATGSTKELSEPLVVIIALRTIITARILARGATGDAYFELPEVSIQIEITQADLDRYQASKKNAK
jgi:hypothetical protein